MALTDAQLVTLKADIDSKSTPGGVLENKDNAEIRDYYNGQASPDYWIYRSNVSMDEVALAIDLQDMVDITAADSDRVMKIMELRREEGFDGTNERDRSAFDDAFSSAAGDNSQQAIAALWSRLATVGEQVFATSTGTGSSADPDTTDFEGSITLDDVRAAVVLP